MAGSPSILQMEGYSFPEEDINSRGGSTKPGPKWTTNPMDSFRYATKAVVTGKCAMNRKTWLSELDTDHGNCEIDDDYQLI